MKMNERQNQYDIARKCGMSHEDALKFAIKVIPNGNRNEYYYEQYPLILKTEPQRKQGWFVSKYNEYPIYEPAEGGYYYAGVELTESHEFNTRRKAMKYMRKVFKELKTETEDKYFSCNASHTFCIQKGKLIGDGVFYQLECIQGKSERGYEPYC